MERFTKRFTKRFTDGGAYCEEIEDVGIEGINAPTYIGKAVDKLAEYEDLADQGLLLRLPCQEGAEVWEIEKLFWIDRKGCKDCLCFGNDGLGEYCDYDGDNYPSCTKVVPKKFTIRMLEDFGKTVFLTKEEAEQVLGQGIDKSHIEALLFKCEKCGSTDACERCDIENEPVLCDACYTKKKDEQCARCNNSVRHGDEIICLVETCEPKYPKRDV